MPIDSVMLNAAIAYHTSELHRLLGVRSDSTGISPRPTLVLLAALLDFMEAEASEMEVQHDA